MTQPQLGRANIEVRADLANFPAELRTKLVASLKEALTGVEFTELGDKAERAGEDAGRRVGKGFQKTSKESLKKSSRDAGKSLLDGLIGFFDSKRDGGGGGLIKSIGGAIAGGVSTGLQQLQAIGQQGGQAFGQLGNIGSSIGGAVQIAALASAIPVALGLAGALVQLSAALFALPAAASVAGAAIAPLVIAFQGFGEAVGAGLSGDTEAFNEALKGLAPSARAVAREFVGIGPILKSIKQTVQQAFFAPLVGSIAPLARGLLPELQRGLALVAGSLGNFGAQFLELLNAPDIVEAIGDVFESTKRIIDQLSPSIVELLGTLFGIMEKGLPFVEKVFGGLGSGIDRLSGFLSQIQQDGSLVEWLERAYEVGKDLFDLLGNTTALLVETLGGEIGDAGAEFIENLGGAVESLREFFQTAEGQEALHNLATLVEFAGEQFINLVRIIPLLLTSMNDIFSFFRGIGPFFKDLGGDIADIGESIGDFFSDVGDKVATFFTETIPDAFDAVVEFFAGLPDKAVEAGGSLRDKLGEWIKDAFLGVYNFVLEGIGNIVGLLLALPPMALDALAALPETLRSIWDSAWSFAVEAVNARIDQLQEIVAGVPELLSDAGKAIRDFFTNLWNDVSNYTVDRVKGAYDSVISFFQGIPGRITALGPRVLEAARGIGQKIADGLAEIGNFATDLGARVVRALKSGINFVIDGINRGIGEVDAALPVDLPRIPKLAKGAIIDSPTLAIVGEAGREVVIPTDDPARARELAQKSGLFSVLNGGRAGTVVNVTAILDGYGVIKVVRTVVDEEMDQQGRELDYGARAA